MTDDSIYLDNAVFTKLGSGSLAVPKLLSSAFFRVGTKALDENDHIIYDKTAGDRHYDADASGQGTVMAFAKVTANLALSYKDLLVV
ncbi:hypothetical protein AA309_18460 [Microvirga vignae]|uniref:Uncharacterized protein n=1 Tax=Microvirga vignae TaxID=1225564 RepID=A0A0H1R927_9HYPH|nr:hypothetical protein [Microvirga vignae]KLK91740.1 hypothetical protein AA309_18460 [Microvirga vignae]